MISAKSILLPYELRWVNDPARLKIGCWSRQTGKSISTADEAVEDCFTRRTDWVCMSAGERQALEWIKKAKLWTEAYQISIAGEHEDRSSSQALMRSASVTFPNGSRIISIPSNPATARGYSANIVLDEFAHHERPDEMWAAIAPSITRQGLKMRVVSTANGQGNKFHSLWTNGRRWSKHSVTIHDAIADGLPVDVEELRDVIGDPEVWAQEYECQFLDASSILLPYELIQSCEHDEASADYTNGIDVSSAPIWIGIDFARSKHKTVAWIMQQIGDVLWTRGIVVLQDMSTPEQIEQLRPIVRWAKRVSLDYTGPGIGFGDYLAREFHEYDPTRHKFGKIELCTFTNPFVCDVMSKLRMAFEQKRIRIPPNRDAREDLHAIQRTATATGKVTYRAPFTADGHSDRAYALALAIRAADQVKHIYHAELI
jgi:phage FluMu gp28-like protein